MTGLQSHFFKGQGLVPIRASPFVLLLFSLVCSQKPGLAQIVPDSTLGLEASTVPAGAEVGTLSEVLIEGGAQRDTSLFHSFEQFNSNTNQEVQFFNPVGVDTIFSRVTGVTVSTIDGLLGVDGPADLFLLNPNGVIFGPNAQLDLGGGFITTTANSFNFANGSSFSSVNPGAPPLLTVNVPVGLQFGNSPQPITVNGASLETEMGQPLALLGGTVTLDGATLTTPGGFLVLSGLSEPGTMTLDLTANTPQTFFNMPDGVGRANVGLMNDAIAQTIGDGDGDIVIQSRNLFLSQSRLLAGIDFDAGFPDSQAGSILLDATGSIQVTQGSSIQNVVEEDAFGDGGDILVRAENFDLRDSTILTQTASDGSAGNINFDVTNRIFAADGDPDNPPPGLMPEDVIDETFLASLADGSSMGNTGSLTLRSQEIILEGGVRLEVENAGPGQGEDIVLESQSLVVRQGSNIENFTSGVGASGDIRIQATNILLDDRGGVDRERSPLGINTTVRPSEDGVSEGGVGGVGGDVVIDTQNLTLIGALLGATVVGTEGEGGDVIIRASDTVRLVGDQEAARSVFAGVAEISTAIRGDAAGAGGDIRIDARHLILENGSILDASAEGAGNSGDIEIRTTDSVTLQGTLNGQPSRIISQLQNEVGTLGGNIEIETGQLTVQDGGQISAATTLNSEGNGGSIIIQASQGINLSGSSPSISLPEADADSPFVLDPTGTLFPSGIFANSPGEGNAGSVDIETSNLTVWDGARISISSQDFGVIDSENPDAGSLTVIANNIDLDNAVLSADVVEGEGGNINLVVQDTVKLRNGSSLSTNASLDAIGGNIEISNPFLLLLSDRSTISANNSGQFEDSNGGFVTIDSQFVIATPSGPNQIIANAFAGNGGDINITTTSLFGRQFLDISASSQFGLNGEIEIDSPEVEPDKSLTPLPVNLRDPSNQVANACTVEGPSQSQFLLTGRGGLPPRPANQPTGMALLPDLGPWAIQAGGTALQEAQGWTIAANGKVSLMTDTPEMLIQEGGRAYRQANYTQAVTLWSRGLKKLAQGSDQRAYISTQSNLALAYQQLGDWRQAEDAIATLQSSFSAELQLTHPELLAQVLNTKATLHLARGDARAALTTWQQAEVAYQQADHALGQTQAQLNQTQALQTVGLYPQAQTLLETVVATLTDQPPTDVKAIALLNLGAVLRARGEQMRSQQVLKEALVLSESLNRPDISSSILLNLGHIAQADTQPDQALDYYQKASTVAPTSLGKFQAQVSQFDLALTQEPQAAQRLWSELQQQVLPASREAIYAQLHLVQAALKEEQFSASPHTILALLSTTNQQAQLLQDPIAQNYALGYLGQVYGTTQQWARAQALTEKALQQAETLQAPEIAYQWAWQLGRLRQAQGKREGAIHAYRAAVNALRTLRGDLTSASADVQFTFRDGVEPLYRELVRLLLESEAGEPPSQTNLQQARTLIEELQLAELQDYFQDACTKATPVLADQVDPKAAVIYPILLKDRLDVLVSVAGQPVRYHSTPVAAEQVEQTAQQLLRSLSTPLGSFQPNTKQHLQEVYNWILGPVAAELSQQSIETLVFVADGALRTLPMASLHDGEHHLIERYNVVLSPGLDLLDPRPLDRQGLQMLAAGLSESRPGFPPLPFVNNELEQITTQIPNNKLLFNQDLTQKNLTSLLSNTPADVVHIATHGEFGTNADETYILTWDGTLTMKELGALLQTHHLRSETPVELLVLSACQTARGDSRAVLGIAGMAVRSGVRSALAGLWSLHDQAAAKFMARFYEALAQPNVTKAEAFRQAQLSLMQDPKFRSPYYWSPFVLVGNWL